MPVLFLELSKILKLFLESGNFLVACCGTEEFNTDSELLLLLLHAFIHSISMSSASSTRQVDIPETPSSGQNPFPQTEAFQRFDSSDSYGVRRGSRASSVTSITSLANSIDSLQHSGTLVEVGKNGWSITHSPS